jgi:CubicO group peptidase (beta-lactamase class C family)
VTANIDGLVAPGFEGVRDAFAQNFAEHGEVGAGCSIYVEGRKVVDLWGGVADQATGRAYDESTLQLVFSTTKGATAACAALLSQRGELDVDTPVATYWPEFAQNGKESIPVRWLLCHKAGLPVIDKELSIEEVLAWQPLIEALEVQAPVWEPGSAHGYHAVTYGYLVGEVVKRISGKSLGTFFAEEIAAPLGLDFWIGLPASEEARVAPIAGGLFPAESEVPEELRALLEQFIGPNTLLGRALTLNGAFGQGSWNERAMHAAEVPAANGITNASSLARMYAGLFGTVDGYAAAPLLTPAQVDASRERQTTGNDACLYIETAFGLGFMVSSAFSPYGGRGSFGHSGAGGSVGFGDPENRLGFGYVMNKMQQNLAADPRTHGLISEAYKAIGAEAAFV